MREDREWGSHNTCMRRDDLSLTELHETLLGWQGKLERKKEKGGFGARNIPLDIFPHWKPKTTKLRCAFSRSLAWEKAGEGQI